MSLTPNVRERLSELLNEALPLVMEVISEERQKRLQEEDKADEQEFAVLKSQEEAKTLHTEQHFWDDVFVLSLRNGCSLNVAAAAADEAIKRRSTRANQPVLKEVLS